MHFVTVTKPSASRDDENKELEKSLLPQDQRNEAPDEFNKQTQKETPVSKTKQKQTIGGWKECS